MKKLRYILLGAAAGLLNGLFGSGGGAVVVPGLEAMGHEPKKAHAESVAVILPLSVISAVYYCMHHDVISDKLLYIIPCGLAGAALGALSMKKIPTALLKRIFGVLLVAAGVRSLL